MKFDIENRLKDTAIVNLTDFENAIDLYEDGEIEKALELMFGLTVLGFGGDFEAEDREVRRLLRNRAYTVAKSNETYCNKVQSKEAGQRTKLQLDDIAEMMANGATQQIIADSLCVSLDAVKYRVKVMKEKFPSLYAESVKKCEKCKKVGVSVNNEKDNDNDNEKDKDKENNFSSSSLTESKGWETVEKMKELYPFDAANSVETKADLMAFVIAYKGENFATARVNQQIKDTKVSPKDCARALYYLDAKEMKGRFCKGIEPTIYLCLKDENIVSANNYFEKEIAQKEAIAHSFQVAEENKKIIHTRIPSPQKKTPTYNIDEIN